MTHYNSGFPDLSPNTIFWLNPTFKEKIKNIIRRPFNYLLTHKKNKNAKVYFSKFVGYDVDKWLIGQRGNDYAAHRRRVNKFINLNGKKILVAGSGIGRDIPSWLKYNPSQILGIDFFNYHNAWALVKNHFSKKSRTIIDFKRGDLSKLDFIESNSFDVISSDAVLEHVKDLESVMYEFNRILKPGGILYSTYGPLWYSWHGDHYSGWDKLENGYNHLLLDKEKYEKYLSKKPFFEHSEDDGRTWIENDLFSYATPKEYLKIIEKSGFEKCYVANIIEQECLNFSNIHREKWELLINQHQAIDLLISGMSIIYRKPLGN